MFMRVSAYRRPQQESDDDDVPVTANTRVRKISSISARTNASRSTACTSSSRSSYRDDLCGYREDDGKPPRSSSLFKLFKGKFKSNSSLESNDSANSGKSRKTKKWHYSIENFEGPKIVDDQTKYLPHEAVWAQAYAFGGR